MKKLLLLFTLCLTVVGPNMVGQSACTPHNHPSNAIRSKAFMDAGGQIVANDFLISANTLNFAMDRLEANLWTQDDEIASLDLVFYQNSSENHPGTMVGETISNIIPTSQLVIDNEDGFQIRKVIIDLSTPFDLEGTGTAPVKYWVQIIAHPTTPGKRVGWEINGIDVDGQGVNYSNPSINFWYVNENWDGVFSLSGECTVATGCLIPEALSATNIGNNEATINWIGFPEAESYILVYGESGFDLNGGEGQTITIPGGQTSITLEGLELISEYDVYIKTICQEGESIFTVPFSFTTTDLYCDIDVIEEIDPISYVEFAGIANRTDATLDESPGHEFFLDIEGEVIPGQTYTFTSEGNTGGNYANGVTVFIDWNQDGVFDNVTERYDIGVINNSTGEDGQQISADILVPTTVVAGNTRMRVLKEFYPGVYVPDACAWLSYGQVEDYTISISLEECQGTPNAGSATVNPVMGNVNNNYVVSATDYSVNNGITYQWQSNTDGAGWIDEGEGQDFYAPYNATAPSEGGIEVAWRLKVTCTASQETSYSEIAIFTTYTQLTYCEPLLSCEDNDVITKVSFQEIDNITTCSPNGFGDYTTLSATVSAGQGYPISVTVGDGWNVESVSVWVDFNNDGVFEINEFFYLGTGSGETITGEIVIPYSLEDGEYRMRVRVAAVDFDGATWDMSCNSAQTYGETEDYTIKVQTLSINDFEKTSVSLFPNPTSDILNLNAKNSISQLVIYDMLGQKVMERTIGATKATLDVSQLSPGIYLAEIRDAKGSNTLKFIKN